MRRTLTDAERQAQANLKRLWSEAKRRRKFTQAEAAHDLGWESQSSVNHYLNGRLALNLEAAVKFARFLGVQPGEIHPDFAGLGAGLSQRALTVARGLQRLPEELQRYVADLVQRYAGLSEEALNVATKWQKLTDEKRQSVEQLIDHLARP